MLYYNIFFFIINFYHLFSLFSELLSVIQRKFFHDGRPVSSTIAISSGECRLCGEIMGMSILQGGPAPLTSWMLPLFLLLLIDPFYLARTNPQAINYLVKR